MENYINVLENKIKKLEEELNLTRAVLNMQYDKHCIQSKKNNIHLNEEVRNKNLNQSSIIMDACYIVGKEKKEFISQDIVMYLQNNNQNIDSQYISAQLCRFADKNKIKIAKKGKPNIYSLNEEIKNP